MDLDRLRRERLRSHRLTAPARTVTDAAAHLMATQAQEFWGGRWALGARTAGEPALRDVDAALDRGELVRSWTMRGTLHLVAAMDLPWLLPVTAERQERQFATTRRALGLDDADLQTAERAARAALSGGNRLTRAELAAVVTAAGVDCTGSRTYHVLAALALRGVVVQGPVVPRATGSTGPTREQYLVATDDWIPDAAPPPDPLAELFVRYLRGHGPASLADFAWWSGLPKGLARTARESAGARVAEVEDGLFAEDAAAHPPPRRRPTPAVVALPPFEEYYISYADRSAACPPERAATVGPGVNGLVKPILLAGGEIVGVWRHSLAAGKHHLEPEYELHMDAVDPASVDAALARYARFIRG